MLRFDAAQMHVELRCYMPSFACSLSDLDAMDIFISNLLERVLTSVHMRSCPEHMNSNAEFSAVVSLVVGSVPISFCCLEMLMIKHHVCLSLGATCCCCADAVRQLCFHAKYAGGNLSIHVAVYSYRCTALLKLGPAHMAAHDVECLPPLSRILGNGSLVLDFVWVLQSVHSCQRLATGF